MRMCVRVFMFLYHVSSWHHRSNRLAKSKDARFITLLTVGIFGGVISTDCAIRLDLDGSQVCKRCVLVHTIHYAFQGYCRFVFASRSQRECVPCIKPFPHEAFEFFFFFWRSEVSCNHRLHTHGRHRSIPANRKQTLQAWGGESVDEEHEQSLGVGCLSKPVCRECCAPQEIARRWGSSVKGFDFQTPSRT